MKTVGIAGKPVGEGLPVFVIAEAGVNHNGDVSRAGEVIDAAAAGGADHHDLPCQVSLEEYMACGVGGCAGCAEIETAAGPAMKRVCVDGPVFDGYQAFPA